VPADTDNLSTARAACLERGHFTGCKGEYANPLGEVRGGQAASTRNPPSSTLSVR